VNTKFRCIIEQHNELQVGKQAEKQNKFKNYKYSKTNLFFILNNPTEPNPKPPGQLITKDKVLAKLKGKVNKAGDPNYPVRIEVH